MLTVVNDTVQLYIVCRMGEDSMMDDDLFFCYDIPHPLHIESSVKQIDDHHQPWNTKKIMIRKCHIVECGKQPSAEKDAG